MIFYGKWGRIPLSGMLQIADAGDDAFAICLQMVSEGHLFDGAEK